MAEKRVYKMVHAEANRRAPATATAAAGTSQAGDGNCRLLRVRVDAGNIFYGAAAPAGVFDESDANRCWVR